MGENDQMGGGENDQIGGENDQMGERMTRWNDHGTDGGENDHGTDGRGRMTRWNDRGTDEMVIEMDEYGIDEME